MSLPARGLLLVRKPVTTESYGHGSVALLPGTRDVWTRGQAVVLAIGPLAIPEEPDDYEGPLTEGGFVPLDDRIREGAWVLTRTRAWHLTDVDGQYLVPQADVVGIFLE